MSAMTATADAGSWLPRDRPLTVDDLEGQPDDGHRYELIDGVLVVSPAPSTDHQLMVLRLWGLLDAVRPDKFLALAAPYAVHPDPDERTELQPDVLVALDASYSAADLPQAPLLAIEVLSPSTRMFDLALKRAKYEEIGTPSYWVLDPKVPDLRAFELDDDGVYQLVAHVRGEEAFEAVRPFPVSVRPDALLRRGR